jgi:uncharacterized Zn-finger protein
MTEERKLPFKCPNPECGTIFSHPLSWFKQTKRISCPTCLKDFTVDCEKMPELKQWLKLIRESPLLDPP